MNWTAVFAWVSLLFGLFLFVFAVTVLGTPPLDVGMASTAGIFVLFGVLGHILVRVQAAEAA